MSTPILVPIYSSPRLVELYPEQAGVVVVTASEGDDGHALHAPDIDGLGLFYRWVVDVVRRLYLDGPDADGWYFSDGRGWVLYLSRDEAALLAELDTVEA